MTGIKPVVVYSDMVTPYGWGVDLCWNGLLSGKTAIGPLTRFETESFHTVNAALVPDLSYSGGETLVMQMLTPLINRASEIIPEDTFLILATTTGEIEILERSIIDKSDDMFNNASASRLDSLLDKLLRLNRLQDGQGMVISAACASSGAAIARGASLIGSGEHDSVLIIACDCVSEFVFAGFSSLMALDKNMAHPFDKNRSGLTLGEAAGCILMMSEARAQLEKKTIVGEVAGWGLTNDANHMTAPSRDGSGLAQAVKKAMEMANISKKNVGCVSAHGTGTVYNDSMEMKAFKTIFKNNQVPIYSIKGGTGHTMGAAGLLETILAFESLKTKIVLPTVNMNDVDVEAEGWVLNVPCHFNAQYTISTNSGFGGINCALVLKT